MTPSSTLDNIADRAFADAESPPQLRDRVLPGRIQSADLLNLLGRKLRAAIPFALQRPIVQPGSISMLNIFSAGAVFEIIRSIVALVAVFVVDLYATILPSERFARIAQKGQCYQVMHLFGERLSVFAKVDDEIAATLGYLWRAVLRWPSAASRIDALNRSDVAQRRYFVDAFVSWDRFPYFHLWPPVAVFCPLYYTTFSNICDWKAAGERYKNGSIAQSLAHNRERFGISDQLYAILENTVKELGW